ncbi:MAG: (d)CMP kinase [Candidatus Marinimicrobia bacterium]|nr:(d)CMP kinase [Candidatus Neomarinimicrobiota bacterium]
MFLVINAIAIDGPGASGKSTTAKLVAERLGYMHLDTGAMYRAVTLACVRENVAPEDSPELERIVAGLDLRFTRDADGKQQLLMNGADVSLDIRTPEISRLVSAYSALPYVRERMLEIQRAIGSSEPVVCEGRDIGTRVFPDARFKFFLSASLEERARRRHQELEAQGFSQSLESIIEELEKRDRKDSTRAHSPLRQAADTLVVDTSNMTIHEQVEFVINHITERGLPAAGEKV